MLTWGNWVPNVPVKSPNNEEHTMRPGYDCKNGVIPIAIPETRIPNAYSVIGVVHGKCPKHPNAIRPTKFEMPVAVISVALCLVL